MEYFFVVRILFFAALAFTIAILWTPLLTHFLYKYKLGKRIRDGENSPIYSSMHRRKAGTPTMGGVLVWLTTLILILFFSWLPKIFNLDLFNKLNFLSRSQTLLPLGMMVFAALVGLVDDILNVRGIGPKGGGLRMRHRLLLYSLIALVGALWFFFKLDWDLIHVPFVGEFQIGWWYIPTFVLIIVATGFSVNEADGLDGLAGGLLLFAFASFGAIAFIQGKFDLAVLCGVISGSLAAFLWFNIYPARFFMGDTGAMSLGVTLGVIAMLTNSALLLPIICLLLVIESLSVIIQVTSKKVRHKKIFLSTPIHHHFEAKGWPEPKVVMRFWVIAGITAAVGLIIALLDKTF